MPKNYLQQFIEASIKGGWNKDWCFSHISGDEVIFGNINNDSENNPCYYKNKYELFLDPELFKCAGKTLGEFANGCLPEKTTIDNYDKGFNSAISEMHQNINKEIK